jgi:hypothetical protein
MPHAYHWRHAANPSSVNEGGSSREGDKTQHYHSLGGIGATLPIMIALRYGQQIAVNTVTLRPGGLDDIIYLPARCVGLQCP